MSALDDKTKAIKDAVVQVGNDLTTLIADLKQNTGAPTPEQLQALDDIAASLVNVDTTIKQADPGAPPAA